MGWVRPRALRSRGHPSTSGPGSPTNGGRMGSRVRRRARWALSGTLGPRLRGVGWSPHTPPAGLCPRGPKTVQIRPLLGSNFSGFLAPCGAKSRGGGGAPPTTLILLRNQWLPKALSAPPSPRTRRGLRRGSRGAERGVQGSQRRGGGWPPLGEVGEVGCRWGSAPVAPGGPARPKERGLTPLR